jgi:hypothetical protein
MLIDMSGKIQFGKLTHDGLGLAGTTVGNEDRLGKDVLSELVALTIVNSDLDLLHNHDNGGLVPVLVPEVGLAEEVVQVLVEAILLLVDNEDLVDLLDDLFLEAIIHNLKVLLLDLDDLLLVVEVIEAIDEVESLTAEPIREGALTLIVGERMGHVDRFGNYVR